MPIYQYSCKSCDHALEALQKMSDQPLLTCPECGEDALKKQLTAAAFKLKGTGWYETDFKNSGKPKAKPESKSADTNSSTQASQSQSSAGATLTSD